MLLHWKYQRTRYHCRHGSDMVSVHGRFGRSLLGSGRLLVWISTLSHFFFGPHGNNCERKFRSKNPKVLLGPDWSVPVQVPKWLPRTKTDNANHRVIFQGRRISTMYNKSVQLVRFSQSYAWGCVWIHVRQGLADDQQITAQVVGVPPGEFWI